MKKNTTSILLAINALLFVALIISLFIFVLKPSKEIVYIDNIRLFNGFDMAKDLGKINSKKIMSQKKKLDSLYTIYTILKEQNNTQKVKELEIQLRSEDQELKQINETLSRASSQQVWKRLNEYLKTYGEKHEYPMILGTQGNGNVMYAKEGIDITDAVLEYANSKYQGN